jgi:hypothetical protein
VSAGGSSPFIQALKSALLYHWNLLYLGASVAVGIISGRADIVYPLAAAVEILYLALLASNRRYQAVMEARRRHGSQPIDETVPDAENVRQLMQALSSEDRACFERLRSQIQELRSIPESFAESGASGPVALNDRQAENINRLLWIYLKLLHTKTGMETFFRSTDEKQISNGVRSVQDRLRALGPEHEDDDQEVKHRHSLRDMQQTLESRLKNYRKARENYDFLQLELERLNAKIAGIVEMGIHRQDSALISTEIDIVAASVMQTERTMQELESITGWTMAEEKAPLLLKNIQKPVGIFGKNES